MFGEDKLTAPHSVILSVLLLVPLS